MRESDEKGLQFTNKFSLLRDKKQVYKSDLQATTKEKKCRQAEDQSETHWEAAPCEHELITSTV